MKKNVKFSFWKAAFRFSKLSVSVYLLYFILRDEELRNTFLLLLAGGAFLILKIWGRGELNYRNQEID
jgi:hypothetical protein